MSELTIILVVFVCGLAAMFVELFLPGAVIGMIWFFGVIGSIVYAFVTGHHRLGAGLIVATVAFMPFFFLVWKNVLGKYFASVGDEKDFRASTTINDELVGKEGIAVTPLHPTGIARIDERRYDVVTRGEMLEKGTRIEVEEVSGNRIVVRRI